MKTIAKAIDCFTPLSVESAKAIKAAGYSAVCRYLCGKNFPQWGKGMTPVEVATIKAAGLKIISNFEANETSVATMTFDHGVRNGAIAVDEAKWIGQPNYADIYFSADFDAQPKDFPAIENYFVGVARSVGSQYPISVYGKREVIEYLLRSTKVKIRHGWQPAAWSHGIVDEHAAIFQDKYNLQVRGVAVDEDLILAEPGWWPVVQPKPVTNTPTPPKKPVEQPPQAQRYAHGAKPV